MRHWFTLGSIVLVSVLLLAAFLGVLAVPSRARGVPLGADLDSVAGGEAYDAVASTNANTVTPITQSEVIESGVPMWLRDVGVVLEFAPGVTGVVTVAMSPATPHNPPPGGAISRSWWITTTSPAYEVSATFIYTDVVRDIVLVFDHSGSMEFDTLCYGCWVSDGAGYPSGTLYPLPWDGPANGDPQHCDQTTLPYQTGGRDYYFIEAEEYSYASNTYNRDFYSIGYTYWVLQRYPNSASARWRSVDNRGAYIMHMPFPDMEQESGGGVTCRYEQLLVDVSDPPDGIADFTCWSGAPGGPYAAPRVDYYFAPKYDGDFYIWVRGQSAGSWNRGDNLDRRLFWGIDGALGAGQVSTNCGGGRIGCETDFPEGTGYNGARNDRWQWRRLNDTSYHWLAGENHTLNIWAGGAEFALDRIVITTNPNGSDGNPPAGPITENSQRGRYVWADGRSGWACDPCDPRFAGYPADHPDRPPGFDPSAWIDKHPVCDSGPVGSRDRRADDIYDDEQPIRASIESVKLFVDELLDPAFDQIGYVSYSNDAVIRSHLQCLRRLGEDCSADVIENTIISELDGTVAGGGTNTAGGMKAGLEALSAGPRDDCEDGSGACGHPGAIPVLFLMTDGLADKVPDDYCYDVPGREWPGGNNAQDCVIYYAHEARDQGVIINTITLGIAADFELMQTVADLTGGMHRNTDRPEKLCSIWKEFIDHLVPPFAPSHIGVSPGESPQGEAIYHRATPTGDWTLYPLTMTQIFTKGWVVAEGITSLSEWTVGYLPPSRIVLEIDPVALPANGVSTAILTATVTDVYSQPMQDGTVVTFATSLGSVSTIPGSVALPYGVTTGVVTAILTTGLDPGWAVITATAGDVTGTISAEFWSPSPRWIMLDVVPDALPADGVSTAILTATVTDVYSQPVTDGTVVTFATSLGSLSSPTGTTAGGVVTTLLTAGSEPGWAVITATAGEQIGTVQVQFGSFLYLPIVMHEYEPGSVPPSSDYCLGISFEYIMNTLPFEQGHDVDVLVTGCATGGPWPDLLVSFSTTEGAFDYSGVEDPDSQYAEAMTSADGIAARTVYANDPTTAVLRTWVDLDGDDTWNARDPLSVR